MLNEGSLLVFLFGYPEFSWINNMQFWRLQYSQSEININNWGKENAYIYTSLAIPFWRNPFTTNNVVTVKRDLSIFLDLIIARGILQKKLKPKLHCPSH